jgi:hypothetical protein
MKSVASQDSIWIISRGPLMNDEDMTIRLSTFSGDPSPECMLSTKP